MKHKFSYKLVALTLSVALIMQSCGKPAAFEIISPADGGLISGSVFFAIQTADPEVTRVSFKAGNKDLGTDSNSADGFGVFLNAADFPAGSLTLSATAGSTKKEITVTVVPDPPSSGEVGAGGAVFHSEKEGLNGYITVPPGAVPEGTTITVTEMTQEETTAKNGIDWEKLEVIFLGAREVQSSEEFTEPIVVNSVGLGNRVQPGQAVVTYGLVPDQDGDNVDEIVVLNSASVAPNGDVISDPVSQIVLAAIPEISGSPGTIIELKGTGFNTYSLGNVARYRSLVDGTEIEFPAFARADFASSKNQIFWTVIPILPPGKATLTLHNYSTGSTSEPITITVKAPPPLSGPREKIIDQFLVSALKELQELSTSAKSEGATFQVDKIDQAIEQTNKFRFWIQEISVNPTSEDQQMLTNLAILLDNPDLKPKHALTGHSKEARLMSAKICDKWDQVEFIMAGYLGLGGAVLASEGVTVGAVLAGTAVWTAATIGAAAAVGVAAAFMIGLAFYCLADDEPPPAGNPTRWVAAGMGSTLASGGSAGGSVVGAGAGAVSQGGIKTASLGGIDLTRISQADDSGRVLIKLFSGGLPSPFTGMADKGGYFFLPIIPEGEPFTAVAIDMRTGETRTATGIGPALGESIFLFFNFLTGESSTVPIEIGKVVTGEFSSNGETDLYSFSAQAGRHIFFDIQEISSCIATEWQLVGESGILFDLFVWSVGLSDPGSYTLASGGRYTVIVTGEFEDCPWTDYQFQIWNVPPPNKFNINIGDVVQEDVPGPGAGKIESPGAQDIYTFTANPGQVIFLDAQQYSNSVLSSQLTDQMGNVVLDGFIDIDSGPHTLETGGTYTLTVGGDYENMDDTYQFEIWNVPPPHKFNIKIGDVVQEGVPGPGAGNLESPGVQDIYTFTATAGQEIFFDVQDLSSGATAKLVDSEQSLVYNEWLQAFGGIYTLEQGGTYTLTIYNRDISDTGTYQFQIWNLPSPDTSLIRIDDVNVITGNIESPAARDKYTFSANPGQEIFFVPQGNNNIHVYWSLEDSDGDSVGVDVTDSASGPYILLDGGTYTLTVGDVYDYIIEDVDYTGTYQFRIKSQP